MSRQVVVLFGPPGAGKTTLAHTLGLEVYDRDDPEWRNDEARFRAALRGLARNPRAQAVVIRTGATRAARASAAAMCGATETQILATPEAVCHERIRARGRGDIRASISGATLWWKTYEPGETLQVAQGATSRVW